MWAASDYALLITSTASLFAIFIPLFGNLIERRSSRKDRIKQEFESSIFYILDNFSKEWNYAFQFAHEFTKNISEISEKEDINPEYYTNLYSGYESIFRSRMAVLGALCRTHGVDDAGFLGAVESFFADKNILLTYPQKENEESWKKYVINFAAVGIIVPKHIENVNLRAKMFLANVYRRF